MLTKKEPRSPRVDSGERQAGVAGIDIFQKLVSIARSPDRTMASMSQWIISNESRVPSLSISSIARETEVSETTVVRFCKLLGLSGYKDLRFALVESQGLAMGARLMKNSAEHVEEEEGSFSSIVRRVIETNYEQLLKTKSLVSTDALEEATKLIVNAKTVHLVGFGSSAPVAFDFYQRLLCLGLNASVHSDPHIIAAVTANAPAGTVFFGISCSGRSRDTVEALEAAGNRGCKRIAITSDASSPLTQVADIILTSAVRRSPVALDVIGTRISQLAIVEMICVALAIKYPRVAGIIQNTVQLEREIEKKRVS